jgi:hypothetical protein
MNDQSISYGLHSKDIIYDSEVMRQLISMADIGDAYRAKEKMRIK